LSTFTNVLSLTPKDAKETNQRQKQGVSVSIVKETEHRTSVTHLNKLVFHVEKYERLHAKMLIIDDSEAYIGSANFIRSSEDNAEAGICTTDSHIVTDAMLYFEDKWDEAIERKWS
jgi:phosphatidylserine/phosphatidylglycerophosphate/cardiolipin synthase-like enzyme